MNVEDSYADRPKIRYSFRNSVKDPRFQDFYTFEFVWTPRWHSFLTGMGHFEILILTRPMSPHPMTDSHIERCDKGERLRMNPRSKPTDYWEAQGIALYWLCCFSRFIRDGEFPKTEIGHAWPDAFVQ